MRRVTNRLDRLMHGSEPSTRTARLSVQPVDAAEARRIHDRAPVPGDQWASDYPFDGDLAAIGALLRATERHGEQRPFGYYRITRRSDGLAIGGIGFKGPPENGAVEVGYGLVPSARGQGYATEALEAVLRIAAALGVTTVRADTEHGNAASRRTLEKAGFRQSHTDDELCYYETQVRPAREA